MYGKTELDGRLFDWGRSDLQPSATRPIGLANNRGNFGYLREGTERRDRDLGSAEEDRAHAGRAYSAARFRPKGIVPYLGVVRFVWFSGFVGSVPRMRLHE